MSGVVAVVLAGGQARRMGGGDKGLRPLAGRPLLAHVLDRIRPQVDAVALSANGDPRRFASYGLPVLPDAQPGGPLAGVLAGMRWAAGQNPGAALLTVPTDTPLLPNDLVARLAAARGDGIACAASAGRLHPVVALWPLALADALAAALAAGERGVGRFSAAHGLTDVEFCPDPVDPFMNVNDPDQLAAAEKLLMQSG
jgi:molybdopterin-guanine dinucleotide biosynthesis protein A